MKIQDYTICIADPKALTIWGFAQNETEAQTTLQTAITQTDESIKTWQSHCEKYPETETFKTYLAQEQRKQWQIMTYGEYLAQERQTILNRPLTEITKEEFYDQLNVLPPLKWCTKNGVEMFCMSEMLTGNYTAQYAYDKAIDKYYSKTVDLFDESTWINHIIGERLATNNIT